jgi:hypothetical protein
MFVGLVADYDNDVWELGFGFVLVYERVELGQPVEAASGRDAVHQYEALHRQQILHPQPKV